LLSGEWKWGASILLSVSRMSDPTEPVTAHLCCPLSAGSLGWLKQQASCNSGLSFSFLYSWLPSCGDGSTSCSPQDAPVTDTGDLEAGRDLPEF
jgi:hypothetical protein